MDNNNDLLGQDLHIDSISHSHLKETAMWARLLAIVGFVLSVLMGMAALFASTFMERMSGGIGYTAASGIMVSAIYFVVAAVYFAMSLFLFRFSVKMKAALLTADQENFNVSLYNLKLVYRITGIIVIIYLAILALVLIVAVVAAASAA